MAAQSLSATSIIRPEYNQFNPNKLTRYTLTPHITLHSQWLGTISRSNLSLQSSNPRPFFRKLPPINATISCSLPTAKPDRGATEKIPKWSAKAIKAFAMGELQAIKIKCSNTDTDSLLLGILNDATSFASIYLRANGITLLKVRDEVLKLRGQPEPLLCVPEHPPLTEAAQKALDWAVDEKLKSGDDGEITTAHVLLGVWQQQESLGHQIMATFGFSDEKAKELHSLISKPGFVEEF